MILVAVLSAAVLSASHYSQRLSDYSFKPYVEQLCTPEGRNVLRDAPHDHIHHHALMFATDVNGVNFWGEHNDQCGKQVLISHGASSQLEWQNAAGATLIQEKRTIDVDAKIAADVTLLTWESVLSLPEGKDSATLGGSHYYGLGMRFDKSMDKGGRFFCSTGKWDGELVRGDEYLTQCSWMAYTAKCNGEPVTVAVFDTAKNPRPMLAFTMGQEGKSFAYLSATLNLHREPLVIEKDKPLTLRYRVAVWDGERSHNEVQALYETWMKRQEQKGEKR